MLYKLLFLVFVNKPGTYVDIALCRLTGFSIITKIIASLNNLDYKPSMVFRNIGAKSGEIRTCVLPYQHYGDGYYIVGSKGGGPVDPAWAINAQKNPSCWMYMNRKRIAARARLAEGEEREKIWQQIVDADSKVYLDYQKTAYPRILPIIILDLVHKLKK